MISKSFTFLVTLLLCLPVFVSGDEVSLSKEFKEIKAFREVESITLVKKEDKRSFYQFQNEGEQHWVIREETVTKSGNLTYTVLFNSELKIVHFYIPEYENSQNASLTNSMFLRQFRKKKPAEKPIRLGYGIDAISGATSSVVSLIDAVNRSAKRLFELSEKEIS